MVLFLWSPTNRPHFFPKMSASEGGWGSPHRAGDGNHPTGLVSALGTGSPCEFGDCTGSRVTCRAEYSTGLESHQESGDGVTPRGWGWPWGWGHPTDVSASLWPWLPQCCQSIPTQRELLCRILCFHLVPLKVFKCWPSPVPQICWWLPWVP